MSCIIGHRVDYYGAGILRGQQHMGRWDHKNNTSRKVTHLADEVYNWPQGRLWWGRFSERPEVYMQQKLT